MSDASFSIEAKIIELESKGLMRAAARLRRRVARGENPVFPESTSKPRVINADRVVTVSCKYWDPKDLVYITHTWQGTVAEVSGKYRCDEHAAPERVPVKAPAKKAAKKAVARSPKK